MSTRLTALRTEFDSVKDAITKIERAATDRGQDVSDAEQADIDKLFERAAALKPDIEKESERQDSLTAVSAILAKTQAAAPTFERAARPDAPLPTVGEWMSAHIRSQQGDHEATELLRAVATQTTADNPGLLPIPIVGNIIKLSDSRRPVWNSFTSRPMPAAGKQFLRPRITQRVLMAEQMAELDELASRKMTVASDAVTKRTFAGVLELSEQDIDWTDPSAISLLIQDFVDSYAELTEAVAVATLMTLAAAPLGTWTSTNVGTIISSLTTGIGTIYTDAKRIPDTLWLSMDEALLLAGMSNATTNVSAMTLIKQALSDAGMPLNIVVGPLLPAGTRIIGSSNLVESYENIKGLVQAPDVSRLGVIMAYRGYAATFGLAQGFIRLGT